MDARTLAAHLDGLRSGTIEPMTAAALVAGERRIAEYIAADEEWRASGEAAVWEQTVGDGLDEP